MVAFFLEYQIDGDSLKPLSPQKSQENLSTFMNKLKLNDILFAAAVFTVTFALAYLIYLGQPG